MWKDLGDEQKKERFASRWWGGIRHQRRKVTSFGVGQVYSQSHLGSAGPQLLHLYNGNHKAHFKIHCVENKGMYTEALIIVSGIQHRLKQKFYYYYLHIN